MNAAGTSAAATVHIDRTCRGNTAKKANSNGPTATLVANGIQSRVPSGPGSASQNATMRMGKTSEICGNGRQQQGADERRRMRRALERHEDGQRELDGLKEAERQETCTGWARALFLQTGRQYQRHGHWLLEPAELEVEWLRGIEVEADALPVGRQFQNLAIGTDDPVAGPQPMTRGN